MEQLSKSSYVRYCGFHNLRRRGPLYSQSIFEIYWFFYFGYKSKFWVFQFKLCLTPWLKNRWKFHLLIIRKGLWVLFIHSHNLQINLFIFHILIFLTSPPIPRSNCVTTQLLVPSPKGWKLKLLKFEWKFRGAWVSTSNYLPWNNLMPNNP